MSGKGSRGTCARLSAEVGAACDPRSIEIAACDDQRGLVCNAATRRCEVAPIVEVGEPCPGEAQTYVLRETVCRGGDFCDAGTCTPTRRDGEPCSSSGSYTRSDGACVWPARCRLASDGSGVCTLPSALTCGG